MEEPSSSRDPQIIVYSAKKEVLGKKEKKSMLVWSLKFRNPALLGHLFQRPTHHYALWKGISVYLLVWKKMKNKAWIWGTQQEMRSFKKRTVNFFSALPEQKISCLFCANIIFTLFAPPFTSTNAITRCWSMAKTRKIRGVDPWLNQGRHYEVLIHG